MTYGILVKEWRQHRGLLLATVLVIAGSVLLIAALPVIGKSNDTPLEALRLLHFSLLPISMEQIIFVGQKTIHWFYIITQDISSRFFFNLLTRFIHHLLYLF